MDSKKAILLLGLNDDETVTMENIKKQYRFQALKYHPDKNKSADACEKFQEIHLAYQYLMNYHFYEGEPDEEEEEKDFPENYKKMLFKFLNHIWGEKENNTFHKIIHIVLVKLSTECENHMILWMKNINVNLLKKIYDILLKYKEIFYFSDVFLQHIEEVIFEKNNKDFSNDLSIVLNPTIDDLFDNNLYKFTLDQEVYIVPLWHHELVYNYSGCDLYVRCFPLLPDHIQIDEKNNIIIEIKENAAILFQKEILKIEIGKRVFSINAGDLKIAKKQIKVLYNEGISAINSNSIYDISKKSNIILKIELI
jgi:hypothetical protein